LGTFGRPARAIVAGCVPHPTRRNQSLAIAVVDAGDRLVAARGAAGLRSARTG
jgi:hypothetical protein